MSTRLKDLRISRPDIVGKTVAINPCEAFGLSSAYPNPFNPETSFRLAVAQGQRVEIAVFDVLGQRVEVLYAGEVASNTSRVFRWEASSHASGL